VWYNSLSLTTVFLVYLGNWDVLVFMCLVCLGVREDTSTTIAAAAAAAAASVLLDNWALFFFTTK
jgi:hypothetical protein